LGFFFFYIWLLFLGLDIFFSLSFIFLHPFFFSYWWNQYGVVELNFWILTVLKKMFYFVPCLTLDCLCRKCRIQNEIFKAMSSVSECRRWEVCCQYDIPSHLGNFILFSLELLWIFRKRKSSKVFHFL
jgi:hypothetical protein